VTVALVCCIKVVTSRLGRSGATHSPAGSTASEACSAASDEPETIQWKRGNVLGKGAYGTVSILFCLYNGPVLVFTYFPHPHSSTPSFIPCRACASEIQIPSLNKAVHDLGERCKLSRGSRTPPFPQIDIIGAMVIVWRARGKIIRSVQYCMQQFTQ